MESRSPQPFAATTAREFEPMFSPDGQWIAYHSNESGRYEVYVRSFPGAENRTLVSINGGQDPVWSRTSHELFYWTGVADDPTGGMVQAVSYEMEGTSIRFDRARAIGTALIGQRPRDRDFDLHPDGKRFAVAPPAQHIAATGERQVVLVFNFAEELRRLTSVKQKR
jgi:hypothetical protein